MYKRYFLFVLVLGCALQVSGCGFQPLYAPHDGVDVDQQLQAIHIDVIADRSGQQLRNFLQDSMIPKKKHAPTQYRLKISLSESTRKLGFRKDNTPRHSELMIQAQIQLIEIASSQSVLQEGRKAVTSYSSGPSASTSAFSALVAEEDARKRALKSLSNDIKLLIAGFLSAPDSTSGSGRS